VLRRWLVPGVLVAIVGALAWGLTRVAPRSPLVILATCVLAVVTLKVVEREVRRWFRLWEERAARQRGRSDVRSPRSPDLDKKI
jgi:hypothetical protein